MPRNDDCVRYDVQKMSFPFESVVGISHCDVSVLYPRYGTGRRSGVSLAASHSAVGLSQSSDTTGVRAAVVCQRPDSRSVVPGGPRFRSQVLNSMLHFKIERPIKVCRLVSSTNKSGPASDISGECAGICMSVFRYQHFADLVHVTSAGAINVFLLKMTDMGTPERNPLTERNDHRIPPQLKAILMRRPSCRIAALVVFTACSPLFAQDNTKAVKKVDKLVLPLKFYYLDELVIPIQQFPYDASLPTSSAESASVRQPQSVGGGQQGCQQGGGFGGGGGYFSVPTTVQFGGGGGLGGRVNFGIQPHHVHDSYAEHEPLIDLIIGHVDTDSWRNQRRPRHGVGCRQHIADSAD